MGVALIKTDMYIVYSLFKYVRASINVTHFICVSPIPFEAWTWMILRTGTLQIHTYIFILLTTTNWLFKILRLSSSCTLSFTMRYLQCSFVEYTLFFPSFMSYKINEWLLSVFSVLKMTWGTYKTLGFKPTWATFV